MRIKLMIGLEAPEPKSPNSSKKHLPIPVEDRVREAIELIESDYASGVEWHMLSKLYRDLCNTKKKSKRMVNLINMIEPVLAKYGYHGVDAE